MQTAPLTFARRAEAALDDSTLQSALERAREGIVAKTARAMVEPDYQAWRIEGERVREEALAHLDELLEQFERNAAAAGAQVHFAADAASARRTVAQIARESGCETAIKSKSMLTEEIELNRKLADSGVDILETDLGEYIIQLADSRPSHIIAPVFHMRMEEITELFADRHKLPPKHDPAELVAEARSVLRPRMLAAQLGITGANFLLADSGSSVIVTNEGNGRFCSSLPEVRITIAGIEKLLPSAAELATLLRLLPRAATGQATSAYVTVSTGTAAGGPKEHHIVLVDNGRSRMLAGKYRAMLRCIRCGACMNHCPVYLAAGGHSYNSTYPGPMGAVLSPNLFGPAHDELPHAATMCGACSVACPVRIPLPDLMRSLREDQADAGRMGAIERFAYRLWMYAAARPRLYRLGERLASWLLRLLGDDSGKLSSLPGCAGWFGGRDLRMPADAPLHARMARRGSAGQRP